MPKPKTPARKKTARVPKEKHAAPPAEHVHHQHSDTHGHAHTPPSIRVLENTAKVGKKQIVLVASGDLRLSANQVCWPAQNAMEHVLAAAVAAQGFELVRAHPFDASTGHGFIASQKQGIELFSKLDPDTPLIVAEAVWQYSHHLLAGLTTHRGPILTVANWSGQWPGLVGMLNLNGSLLKAGVPFSTLWSEEFNDEPFLRNLTRWLKRGRVKHDTSHVIPLKKVKLPGAAIKLGMDLAAALQRNKAILGIFDEGCMGMYNAIIPDDLLHVTGVFKERLSQSALYYETTQVADHEARAVYDWFVDQGLKFEFGQNPEQDLTLEQVLTQCKMYIAAVRIADDFGCAAIGIQYQQGLKDLLPASDLVEGTLNNTDRPPVRSRCGKRILFEGQPLPHFNEVDECAGLDALITNRVHAALGQPVETTLHDLRWGDVDRSGTVSDYVWVLLISGAAPPAHFIDGWRGASSERQPPMYFRLGGGTLKGISKPGDIVWSRIYVAEGELQMDIGLAKVVELPREETERRWNATTKQWPIMHAVFPGITRDQMMARHPSNHIQVAYAENREKAAEAFATKAAMATALGIRVFVCGEKI
jgi:hypothetical protein